jgi:predicted xylose isomerase-like sugar epimerase
MIVVVILAPLAFLYASWRQVRKSYQVIRESGGDRYKVLFYDDHFETKGEKNSSTYEYAKLHGIVETDTDFYLEVERGQAVILQKQKCDAELSAFIRGLRKNIQ